MDPKLESLIRDLPDERGARLFLESFEKEHPRTFQKLTQDSALLSDVLALAAWSPLLATTLEQNPEYVSWLSRERGDVRVRSRELLKESLARFALTNSSVTPQVMLARFRRRELLRIYLHDIRRTHTIVETTEELSNLADAILDYALTVARQDLDNRYGSPLRHDEKGRIATAEFCVVALGKLGSCELNYASDIDLLFLYSEDGTTAGTDDRGKTSNREYFIKLAENITKLVGHPSGEGAAYRVDLRLRPHGRDGALASSLAEAIRYYQGSAQQWELQALIRSRSAAGSSALFTQFAAAVENLIYRSSVSVTDALASVRLAKEKIDRKVEARGAGFNVKLQRGGIREIEFIAQALQLAHGGQDDWVRVGHTLISLGRLADRDLIAELERSELSEAYAFLRMLEHRLQMEHGLQTHTLPDSFDQRALIASRMNFASVEGFERALKTNVTNVRRAYDRVFAGVEEKVHPKSDSAPQISASGGALSAVIAGSRIFATHLVEPISVDSLSKRLQTAARDSVNPHRAALMTARIAASLDKSDNRIEVSEENLLKLVQLCGSSEFFSEMVAGNPSLITSLHAGTRHAEFRAQLRAAIDPETNFTSELSAFRRTWSRLLVEIGVRDVNTEITLAESNSLQTELAVAALNVAYLIARREMARRFGRLAGGPRLSVLALGRLASGGVDYGSDLDIILVYDSLVSSPIAALTPDEAYARLGELMNVALSSVTRDGYLYRVDLRLRPNGKNGPLVISSESFLDYVRQNSAIWEWLAYVKLRAVAGDLELGRMIETHARHAVHERARLIEPEQLAAETRRVRELLEKEKGGRARRGQVNIKYAAGSMLDVYFAARYLQLRDDVSDEGADRSTGATLERLKSNGSLSDADYETLTSGYSLLRSVDHQLRLTLGKVAALPSITHPAFGEIATRLGFASAEQLNEALGTRMRTIREAYEKITQT